MDRLKNALLRNRIIFLCFFSIILTAAFFLLANLNKLGIEDWDQHYAYAQASINSLLNYGQLPIWNPYHCGGMTQIGNPQTDFLNPHFLLIIGFGPIIGYKLLFLFYLLLGLIGFYYLGIYFKISALSSLLLASVYMLSGLITIPFAVGMTNFLNIALLPFICLFQLRSIKENKLRFSFYSGIFLALAFLGGYHYFMQIVLFIFSITLVEFWQTKKKRIFWLFIVFFTSFTLLAAVKLLPAIETTLSHPRSVVERSSGYTIKSLAMSLISPDQSFAAFESWNASYGIDENGMYIGLFSLTIFLLGLLYKGKKHFGLVILLLFFLILGFGFNLKPSLYQFLHDLPVFTSMRVAQRYRYFFMLPVVLFIGFGFDFFINSVRKIFKNKLVADGLIGLTLLLSISNLMLVNFEFFKTTFNLPLIRIEPIKTFTQRCGIGFYDKNGPLAKLNHLSSYSDEYLYAKAGYGSTSCYEAIKIKPYPKCQNDGDYQGEYYLEKNSGSLQLLYWSTNRLDFAVNLKQKNTLFINQNYDPGWMVKKNGLHAEVKNRSGLISADLNPGDKKISFYYSPLSFKVGSFISLGYVIILLFFLLRIYNSDKKNTDPDLKTQSNQRRLSGD